MDRRRFLGLVGGGSIHLGAGCSRLAPPPDRGDDGTEAVLTPVAVPDASDEPQTVPAEEAPEDRTIVGERITSEILHVVFEEVRRDASGERFDPGPGHEFVLVTVSMKNVADRFANPRMLFLMRLHDDNDLQHERRPADGAHPHEFDDGRLAPGEVERGDVAFEVPVRASGLELAFYHPVEAFRASDVVRVDLETRLEEPDRLQFDLRVDAHDIGETVSVGGLDVTVVGVSNDVRPGEHTPGSGLAVDVTIHNGSQERRDISAIRQLQVKDERGNSYAIDGEARPLVHDRPTDETTTLLAGETWHGRVPYRVKQDATPTYWIFRPEAKHGGRKTFWRIE